MFKIAHILTSEDFNSEKVRDFLNDHFHPELSIHSSMYLNEKRLTEDQSQQEWARRFYGSMPRTKVGRLYYIRNSTNDYWHGNSIGSVCQKFVWPEFFKSFSKGRILIAELNKEWFTTIWQAQFRHAKNVEFNKTHPPGLTPQEMSGLQTDSFPINTLLATACGIYPLVLFVHVPTNDYLVFIYVPDKALQHSQMTELGTHKHVLWSLHHILDDQWTFDGSRGPKSAIPARSIKPTENINYIAWTINLINARMHDLISIKDEIRREQITMTFNRAVCDCILAVSTQLPYMSKVFLFACLDKLANIQFQISDFDSEVEAWKQLVNVSFLKGELTDFVAQIPCSAGKELANIVSFISDELQIDDIDPDILRDIRNTHHGYGLRHDIVERLFRHSGELNNDITLLTTPLILYILSRNWVI